MKTQLRTGIVMMLLSALVLSACTTGTSSTTTAGEDGNAATSEGSEQAGSDDEYVWISNMSNLPLFVERVYPGLEAAEEEFGVTVRKAGPTEFDLAAFIATVEQECAAGPDGVIVVGGWDPSLTSSVDKCIELGVPTVVTDGDLPDSKRLTYLGTDWTQVGVQQALVQIQEHEGRGLSSGKVATISILGSDNMEKARIGFEQTLEGTGIEVVAHEDDNNDASIAASKAAGLLVANPDLTGFAGFDSESGPGIVTALREAGRDGEVIVTAMEQSPEFFETLTDGTTSALVIENYEVMNYYAISVLYNYNHSDMRSYGLSLDSAPIWPSTVDTGLIIATPDNVDALLEELGIG